MDSITRNDSLRFVPSGTVLYFFPGYSIRPYPPPFLLLFITFTSFPITSLPHQNYFGDIFRTNSRCEPVGNAKIRLSEFSPVFCQSVKMEGEGGVRHNSLISSLISLARCRCCRAMTVCALLLPAAVAFRFIALVEGYGGTTAYPISEDVSPIWVRWIDKDLEQITEDYSKEGIYDCDDREHLLGMANDFRRKHNSAPLRWSAELSNEAKAFLYNSRSCNRQDAPQWNASINTPTAFGLSFVGTGVQTASFKCASAAVAWYYTPRPLNYQDWYDGTNGAEEVQAAVTLLWNETREIGCALGPCDAKKYVVYCFFDLQNGMYEPKEISRNVAPPSRKCPTVDKIRRDQNIVVLAGKYELKDPAHIFCYHEQLNARQYNEEDLLVAIPCAEDMKGVSDYKDASCRELDVLNGLAPGYCPSVHMILPEETLDSIAALYNSPAGSTTGLNLTADLLCCYNAWAQDENGECLPEELRRLEGFYSYLWIPCPEDMVDRNCKNDFTEAGVQDCPDAEELVDSLNKYRTALGLVPVTWEEELVQAANVFAEAAARCPAMWDDFESEESASVPYFILSQVLEASHISSSCSYIITWFWGILTEYSAFLDQFRVSEDEQGDQLLVSDLAGVLVDNSTTAMGCGLQLCSSWVAQITCAFNQNKNDTFPISAYQALEISKAATEMCPVPYYPRRGESLQIIATKFNVSESALLCANKNLLPNEKAFRVLSDFASPIAIPCRDEDYTDCQALQLSQGSCSLLYQPAPGETIDAVAQSRNMSAEDICCSAANNMSNTCSTSAFKSLYIPCPEDGTMEDRSATCAPDICRRRYIVLQNDTLYSVAQSNNLTAAELCCYWGQDVVECTNNYILSEGSVLLIPCQEEIDLWSCRDATEQPPTNATVSAAPASETEEGSSVSAAAIAVPVALGAALMLLMAALIALFIRRRRKRKQALEARQNKGGFLGAEDFMRQFGWMNAPSGGPSTSNDLGTISIPTSPKKRDAPHTPIFGSNYTESLTSTGSMHTPTSKSQSFNNPPLNSAYFESLCEAEDGNVEPGSSNVDVLSHATQNSNVTRGSSHITSSSSKSNYVLSPADVAICLDENGHPMMIGEGGFSKVYKGTCEGCPVVVKVVNDNRGDSAWVHALLREVSLNRKCEHPNVTRFIGALFPSDNSAVMLVFEYLEQGDLFHLLSSNRKQEYMWYNRGKYIARDVAAGLAYLHGMPLIHNDIKSPNIMLDKDYCAKLGDMGMSKIQNKTFVTKKGQCGTWAWAAPELIVNSRVNEKVDIYSFGVVLWELVTGEVPVRGELRKVRVPEDCPQGVADLMRQCMSYKPEQRPTAQQTLEQLTAIITAEEAATHQQSAPPSSAPA